MVRFGIASATLLVLGASCTSEAFTPITPISTGYQYASKSSSPLPGVSSMELKAAPISLPSINVAIDSAALTQYLLETLISNGVPAFFWIVVIAFAAKSIKSAKQEGGSGPNGGLFGKTAVTEIYDDLYGSGGSSIPTFPFNRGPKSSPKNLGIPSNQYLKITKLNDKYQSFEYSLTSATQSKAKAAAQYRSQAFDSALQRSIDSSITEITPAQKMDLLTEEKQFLKQGGILLDSVIGLQKQLTELVIKDEMKSLDVEIGEVDAYTTKNGEEILDATIVEEGGDAGESAKKANAEKEKKNAKKKSKSSKKEISKLMKEIEKQNTNMLRLEMEFVRAVIEVMGADRANAIRAAMIGNIQGGAGVAGSLIKSIQNRPLAAVLNTIGYSDDHAGRNLFVTDFPGDVSASQVETLREEVTAIIRASKPGDEVLVKLQTGGGTVTGYGLAAAQLQRFKQNGMKLTICVEQVAASGGYMMSCVADKIIASPFAVLGSIGVISDLPNVYERLKKEGIEFQTVTAGKYKRTLTPTKKVTEEDLAKSKSDLEDVLSLFKAFVAQNRPSLDIDDVATGETWFGDDALAKGLCDEIRTVDDVLCEYVDEGYDVFSVQYDPTMSESPFGNLLPATKAEKGGGIIQGMTRWVVRNVLPTLKEEIANEFASSNTSTGSNIKERYMVKDPNNASDKIRMEL